MQTGLVKTKLERFIHGKASPAEVKQIDAWLSNGNYMKLHLTKKEKRNLHNYILYDVQCYTAYPLFYPKKTDYVKKTISAFTKNVWIVAVIVVMCFLVFYNW